MADYDLSVRRMASRKSRRSDHKIGGVPRLGRDNNTVQVTYQPLCRRVLYHYEDIAHDHRRSLREIGAAAHVQGYSRCGIPADSTLGPNDF